MAIKIVNDSISKNELRKIAENQFGELVKAVIDIEKEIMAIGGDLHADEEKLLLEEGSKQENLWGVNLHINKSDNGFVEFDSMINVRPSQNNRSRSVENLEIQIKIRDIINKLIL
ncbi:MAG: hypothetical protein UV53_C0015G0012 [Candidatus Azambacteria bacterium GW2011_GWE1_42_9]|nr:MAG: hypothetical protein UU33_C0001G0392 [Candidatus Azambacteria bacterium GW2011_GWF1_41_10]KKS49426.1 MAG: hypothetical protein UV14_C0001G0172 [Candidatus Azambacteria bacterium GW2011_GWF2_42_22]KKS69731.1 MAG: hypothetical protein UV39_C0003G0008 [Candidatus Azambacteria bacterium GW2011_GWA2_42_62]KKS74054.1 MAG: hypothetical protein UV45_C0014G0007 [Candidatus Azambacteria bacterium GW2011_GWB1_42_72]KKS79096.1 MAG: hypothetical protein UV53_C0015G0012 [Candidatus Azambacteria bacte